MMEEQAELRRAKEQALRFLSRRAHSEQELYEKLLRKQEPHCAAAAVASMVELGLLNDREFALSRAQALAERDKSALDIRRKLGALGVSGEDIDAALEEADIDDAAAARRVVEKQYLDRLREGRRQNVMAALARRGFSHRDIVAAVEGVQAELETGREER